VRSLFKSPVKLKSKPSDGTPVPSPTVEAAAPAQKEERKFYEGLFLDILFNRLENMLEHSLEANLVLTEVLSKLALSTVPSLHDFLFETQEILPGIRTLKSILKDLWKEAQTRAGRIRGFDRKIQDIRVTMGVVSSSEGGANGSSISDFDVDVSHMKFMEAYVVLEEFLKELSCISQAKHMVAFMQD
jgi:hypothetical protein